MGSDLTTVLRRKNPSPWRQDCGPSGPVAAAASSSFPGIPRTEVGDYRRGLVVEIAPNVVDVHDPGESDSEEDNDEQSVVVPREVLANRGNGSPPSRRLRLIGASLDALPNSRNMHPSTIPASSTVLREVQPNPYGRCSVLFCSVKRG